jgi:hypothetical protein
MVWISNITYVGPGGKSWMRQPPALFFTLTESLLISNISRISKMSRPKSTEYTFLGDNMPFSQRMKARVLSCSTLITAICFLLVAGTSFLMGRHTAEASNAGSEPQSNIPRM